VPWLTWQIMRRQALQPWIGLPNILAADSVVPEIIQKQATPEALAQAMEHLLNDDIARKKQIEVFRQQRARLKRNTPALIAHALQPFLSGDRHAT
jgi:lipid-A-disaccharide synthase